MGSINPCESCNATKCNGCPQLPRRSFLNKSVSFKLSAQQLRGHILILFLKIIFLAFVGVYILTLPAYYFLVVGRISDFLMPYEVMLCCVSSVGAFVWVSKMILELNKAMRTSLQ